jgi:hypothetical protein
VSIICTINFEIQKTLRYGDKMYLCVLYGYQTNSDYFPIRQQVAGLDTENECVYCAVRTESLNIIISLKLVETTLTLYDFKIMCLL